jgi:C_GCAxxG_C_C family probable redox protein
MSKDKAKEAYEKMANRKMNCAQAVLSSFCEDFGQDRKTALQITQAFGGGMHIDSICGAVTGAYMVLGLSQKISLDKPRESVDKTNALVKDFNEKFKALHGTLYCTKLTGYNLSKPEQVAAAREKKVFNTLCPGFVRDSAKILESLLKQG